jgi:hypothetical protein
MDKYLFIFSSGYRQDSSWKMIVTISGLYKFKYRNKMLSISFNNTANAKRRFSYSSPPADENPISVLTTTINCMLFKLPEAEHLK